MGLLSLLFGLSDESDTGEKSKEQEKKSRKNADLKARDSKKRDWVDEMIFMEEILDD